MKNEKTSKYCLEEAFKYIEMVTNPYEKAKLYLQASELLITMENINQVVFEDGSKSIQTENSKVFVPVEGDFDNIVEDKVKEENTMVTEQPKAPAVEPPVVTPPVQEPTTEIESTPVAQEEVATQTPFEKVMGVDLETQAPLDVTVAYNMLTGNISHEEKVSVASRLTSYNCFEPFKKLVNVSDSESKGLLADFIGQFGYETINKVLYDFNDGTIEMDVFDFINNNNVTAFTNYIDTNFDAIDAKYPA